MKTINLQNHQLHINFFNTVYFGQLLFSSDKNSIEEIKQEMNITEIMLSLLLNSYCASLAFNTYKDTKEIIDNIDLNSITPYTDENPRLHIYSKLNSLRKYDLVDSSNLPNFKYIFSLLVDITEFLKYDKNINTIILQQFKKEIVLSEVEANGFNNI